MANQDVKVSALNSVNTLSTYDLSLETVVDELSETGYTSKKITEGAKASQYLESFTFSNLTTTAKTIVGAINEAASTGGAQIDDTTTTTTSTWSSDKIADELADKAEIADTVVSTASAWSSSRIVGLLPTDTTTGAIASFDDGADGVPIVDGVFEVTATQAGTGDPSPTNPRTISGFTGMNITRISKNLLNNIDFFPLTQTMTSAYYRELSVANGLLPPIKLMAGVTYTLSLDVQTDITPFVLSVGAGNGAYLTDIASTSVNSSWRCSLTFSPTQSNLNNGDILAIRTPRYGVARDFTFTIANVQLEIGNTMTDYTPYVAPTVFLVSFGGTTYGGTFDSVTGVLTVDYAIVDLGSINWIYTSNYGAFRMGPTSISALGVKTKGNIISDIYKTNITAVGGMANNQISTWNSFQGHDIIIKTDAYTDADEFKSDMDGHKVVFEVDTPVQVQLDPVEIKTLLGVNNIYCDTGDSSVTYRADVQKYIDKKIAAALSNRGLNLSKSADPEEVKEEVKEDQEGANNER